MKLGTRKEKPIERPIDKGCFKHFINVVGDGSEEGFAINMTRSARLVVKNGCFCTLEYGM